MSPEPPLHNLPLQLTSFIGREREIVEVKRLLGTSRLLTLTGAGGSGKTRLALHVASQIVGEYPDGVFFVGLAPVTDPALVVTSVAQVLDVREVAGEPLIETLKAYLQDKETLLLLDNFEQVVGAAPAVVDLLLAAPDLKVMVTSRELLRLQGEQQYEVPPLELPDPKQQVSIGGLSQKEAVALFVERARSVRTDFELTEENASSVVQICTRLDGLPLAIELAAARVRILSPQEMLSRLDSRLNLLTGGATNLPARHQTLRNAIDWSYDLLSGSEQKLLRCMAVFQGGRSLEALEVVCRHDGHDGHDDRPHMDVLDGVGSLVDKSMLRPRTGADGETRYWLLVTIHEYAREKLEESGEEAVLAEEHARYCMRLAEEAEPNLTGVQQTEWLNKLEDEQGNLRTALAWASERGSAGDAEGAGIGIRIAGAVWRFWLMRGMFTEGREHLVRALSLPDSVLQTCSPNSRAKALNGAGYLAYMMGDYSTASTLYEQALALLGPTGEKRDSALLLNNLANVVGRQGDLNRAAALHEESLALRREVGDKWGIAYSLGNLGILAEGQGDRQTARVLTEQSMALLRELGDKRGIWLALTQLGDLAYKDGDFSTAHTLFSESLAMCRELGDTLGIAWSLDALGWVAYGRGDLPQARALYEESLAQQREIGNKPGIAGTLADLGVVLQAQGDYVQAGSVLEESLALNRALGQKLGTARSLLDLANLSHEEGDYSQAYTLRIESLGLLRELGHKGQIAACLAGLGGVDVMVGRAERGARLLGAVEALLRSLDTVLAPEDRVPYEKSTQQARALLGEALFGQARQRGLAMSMEQAIEYALQRVPQSRRIQRAEAVKVQTHPVVTPPTGGNTTELSRREVEVLRLLSEGLRNQQIAERLFLSDNTVRAHLYSIYNKLGVTNRTAAARFVQEHQVM